MLLFHGTTIDNALEILKSGFSSYEEPIWNCSGQETYFFHEKFIRNEKGLETKEEILNEGIMMALEQSFFTLAIRNPQDYRGAVLVFDSELMDNKNDIEEDYSCEGMSDIAVCLRNPDMRGLVGVFVMDQSFSSLRLFTLASIRGNRNIMDVYLEPWEEQLVESLMANPPSFEVLENVTYSELPQTNVSGLLKVA